jgi:hypothetical protein
VLPEQSHPGRLDLGRVAGTATGVSIDCLEHSIWATRIGAVQWVCCGRSISSTHLNAFGQLPSVCATNGTSLSDCLILTSRDRLS